MIEAAGGHNLLKISGIALAAILAAAATPTRAEPSGTIVTIGGYGTYSPDFEGAKGYGFSGRPVLSWHKEGEKVWIDMPNDGLDFAFISGENFRIGAVGNLRFQRRADTYRPNGFVHDTDWTLEAGAFAEYWPLESLRTRAEFRYAFAGAEGLIADLSADVVLHPAARWTATAGPRVSFADSTFMNDYYGNSAAASALSGLPTYKAGGGLRSYGAGFSLRHNLTENIETIGYVEYQRLTGDAADSPLVDQRGSADQVSVGLGLKYSFRVPQ